MRHPSKTLALLAALSAPAVATAQTSAEVAARRLLVERADAARSAGRHEEAVDLASRAGQIQMMPSLRLFIASEQRQLGRLADALGNAVRCLREVEVNPAAHNHDVVRDTCRALETDLRASVGQIVVQVPTPLPSELRVTVAGEALNPALYGAPMVVTPGEVTVTATASERQPWRASVHVAAGATASVRVDLAAAPSQPIAQPPVTAEVSPPAPRPTAPPTAVAPPTAAAPDVSTPGSMQRTLGWAAAAGAGVALVGGAIALAVRNGHASTFNTHCLVSSGVATESPASRLGDCQNLYDDGATMQSLAIGTLVTGGVLGVASAVLLLMAPRPRAQATVAFGCGQGPGTFGIACGAVF